MSTVPSAEGSAASQAYHRGVVYAASAYVLWGVIPIYWKLMQHVPPVEIVAHRIVWTLLFSLVVVYAVGQRHQLLAALKSRAVLRALTLSAMLIAVNWGLFIWAVNVGRIAETSLGYYINPLVNFLLGTMLLGERLSRVQLVAVGLACVGVLNQAVSVGVVPWVSLALAVSFGFYGLIRKQVAVESLVGLTIESIVLAPIALGYVIYVGAQGSGLFLTGDFGTDALMIIAGPMTAVPLLLFAAGVRLIKLSTVGFLQYLAPSISLVLAVAVYGEPFTSAHAVTFGFIWAALALISWEAIRRERRYSAA